MAVVVADVIRIGPEFASLPSGDIQAAVTDAALELDAGIWGTWYDLATKWLAAHKLAVSHPELSQVTPIRAYEQMGGDGRGALGTSRYGVEMMRLQRKLGVTPITI
jgi:hypothetical protein